MSPPHISKRSRSIQMSGRKDFREKGKTSLDRQGLIPFQISSAWQHTLRHCSSPYLSFQSVPLSNFNPPICRRTAKWLPPHGFDVTAALSETEPNLQKGSWNREQPHKRWLRAPLTCQSRGRGLSPFIFFFIFITGSCVLAFVKTSVWTLALPPE